MSEKRILERFDLQIPATLKVISKTGNNEGRVINLKTHDVCAGGAFFQTEDPLPEGTVIQLGLIIPIEKLKKITGKQAYFEVGGKVVRTETGGMAIFFEPDYRIQSV